jgi:hypothetical protein
MRIALVLLLVGCGGSSSSPDASLGQRTCEELAGDIEALYESPHGSCETDADCTIVGGQMGVPTCDCAPYVLACGGRGIETNADYLSELQAAISEFESRGCESTRWMPLCDCAPSQVTCQNRACVTTEQSCLSP